MSSSADCYTQQRKNEITFIWTRNIRRECKVVKCIDAHRLRDLSPNFTLPCSKIECGPVISQYLTRHRSKRDKCSFCIRRRLKVQKIFHSQKGVSMSIVLRPNPNREARFPAPLDTVMLNQANHIQGLNNTGSLFATTAKRMGIQKQNVKSGMGANSHQGLVGHRPKSLIATQKHPKCDIHARKRVRRQFILHPYCSPILSCRPRECSHFSLGLAVPRRKSKVDAKTGSRRDNSVMNSGENFIVQ